MSKKKLKPWRFQNVSWMRWTRMIDGKPTVFVVSVMDWGEDITISVFDNKEAAEKYKRYCDNDSECIRTQIDEAPIYSKFLIDEEIVDEQ